MNKMKERTSKFVMPKIWEIDGTLYEVTLSETLKHTSPYGDSLADYIFRKLTFTPLGKEEK